MLTCNGGQRNLCPNRRHHWSSPPFLGLKDSYDANDAYLTVVQTQTLADAAQPPIRGDRRRARACRRPSRVTTVLNSPDSATAQSAFDQLSGDAQASAKGALVADSLFVRDMTFDRLRDVSAMKRPAERDVRAGCAVAIGPSLWAQGFGGWGHVRQCQCGGSVEIISRFSGRLRSSDRRLARRHVWRPQPVRSHRDGRMAAGARAPTIIWALMAVRNWDNIRCVLVPAIAGTASHTNRSVAFSSFNRSPRRLQRRHQPGVCRTGLPS